MTGDHPDALPTAEPPAEFDTYQFVLLRRPASAAELDDEAADLLQAQHLGYLVAMKNQGHLRAAGPLMDQPDERWRGVCVYQVASVDEARRLAELDPAVRAGHLAADVMTWLTPKGALSVPNGEQVAAEHTTAARLQRVARFEAGRKRTPITALLDRLGPTKAFALVYRRFGPRIDPWLLQANRGKIISRVYGLPALLLHTVGRRTAAARVSPLLYVRDGQDFAIAGTNFGQHHHPGWTANLLANPDAEIEVGPERLPVTAKLADDDTWDRLWPKFVEIYPAYQAYLSRTEGRKPRIFVLHPR